MDRPMECSNCGQQGHLFRHCVAPVTSYGVIALRYAAEGLQFLMIRRKDSLSFIEFLRGKYSYMDEEYIAGLLRNMTQSEQERIRSLTFEELWRQLWGAAAHARSHRGNYETSERRFYQLRPAMERLMAANPSPWVEPEWGFPKGRRNPHEGDLPCAVREFQEETGLRRHEFHIIQNTGVVTETFFGSNHVHYCHKYYLAICPPSVEARFYAHHPHMSREVGAIAWFGLEEAMAHIRPDKVEKREIVLRVGRLMKAFAPRGHVAPSTVPVPPSLGAVSGT